MTSEFLRNGLGHDFTQSRCQFLAGVADQSIGGTRQSRCQRLAEPIFQHQVELSLQIAHDTLSDLLLRELERRLAGRTRCGHPMHRGTDAGRVVRRKPSGRRRA